MFEHYEEFRFWFTIGKEKIKTREFLVSSVCLNKSVIFTFHKETK